MKKLLNLSVEQCAANYNLAMKEMDKAKTRKERKQIGLLALDLLLGLKG